ncbi:DNA polymerase III subunit delta [Texas Phoenix palm phytoplasma]|uniref:DNA polymerase III subunit delta n=1 Tax=Texas Phoenix palm phytoplasma TaxID=176709 RepID=UPI001AEEDF2D|nr:DNA polymerase III subunit delta [Texas Phoenix palm phytoplasma]
MKIYPLNLFFCNQIFFLEQKKNILKNFCKKKNYHFLNYKINKDNFTKIIQEIKKELFTSSFFYEKKILFIENLLFIYSIKKIKLSFLLNYFENNRGDIIIFLTEEKNNIPSYFQKIINQKFNIKIQPKIYSNNLFQYISNIFKKDNFIIKDKIINQIIEKTYGNFFLLNSEIKKIKLFHLSNKKIYDEEIINQIIYNEEEKTFSYIKEIIQNQEKINFILFFNKFIKNKKKDFVFFYKIINKLKELIIIKILLNEKTSEGDISFILNCKLNKTYLLIKEAQILNYDKMVSLFLNFSEIYYKLKKNYYNYSK